MRWQRQHRREKASRRGMFTTGLAVLLASAGIMACGGSSSESSTSATGGAASTGTTADAQAEKEATLKYGVLSALTGPVASWGEAEVASLELAFDEINKNGIKVGDTVYRFEPVVYDHAYDPTKAATLARKAIDEDQVDYLESFGAGTAGAVQPLTERANKLFIAAAGGEAFLGEDHPLTFRPYYDWVDSLGVAAGVLKERHPDAKMIASVYPDDDAGHGNAERATAAVEGAGLESKTYYVKRAEADLYPTLTKVLKDKPDAIDVGPSSEELYQGIVKQANQLGFKGPFIFPDTLAFEATLKATPEGAMDGTLSSPCNSGARTELAKTWQEGFDAKMGETQWWAANIYDGARLLAKAIETAQSVDSEKVAEALGSVEIEGATAGGGGTVKYGDEERLGIPRAFKAPYPVCEVVEEGGERVLKQVKEG